MSESTPEPAPAPRSYREVLRDRRLATLLAGDVVSKVGDGMGFVGLPLLALELHGGVAAALAVALVTGAPYLAPFGLSLYFGLGRRRFDPRLVLLIDSAVRVVAFGVLGALALAGRLTLGILFGVLFAGSLLRLLSAGARRLAATGMVAPDGRLAVNGLLGTSDSLALYVAGPALGGLVAATQGPELVLLANGAGFVAMFVAAFTVPRSAAQDPDGAQEARSGWVIMRRKAVLVRLGIAVFLFDAFYGPVEVALPLLVTGPLRGDEAAFGTLWTCFGVGALVGALLTNRFRRVRPEHLLVAIIGGWAACAAALGAAPNLVVAGAALAVGGTIYGPFLAVAYTLVQNLLDDDEQQPVFTLWAAGLTVALPLGLAVGGPLVAAAGPRGGILVSALITILLAPAAAWWLRPDQPVSPASR